MLYDREIDRVLEYELVQYRTHAEIDSKAAKSSILRSTRAQNR